MKSANDKKQAEEAKEAVAQISQIQKGISTIYEKDLLSVAKEKYQNDAGVVKKSAYKKRHSVKQPL